MREVFRSPGANLWEPCQSLIDRIYKPKQVYIDRYRDEVDDFGFNLSAYLRWEPFFRFLFEDYFEIEIVGLENIPADGRAVIVGNHSGVVPLDAMMLMEALYRLHKNSRRIRFLALNWLFDVSGVNQFLKSIGAVPANMQNALTLLQNDELLCIYPEGANGTSKPFSMRYRLMDFNPGFIKAAVETDSIIIPIVTMGFEETYPLLGNPRSLADFLDFPYYPVTPAFPWLPFFSSCMPLPVRVLIKIGEPIRLEKRDWDHESRADAAREIQYKIQADINRLLAIRKSPFSKWDLKKVALV